MTGPSGGLPKNGFASISRHLAAKAEYPTDYTILRLIFITLGLLLLVELFRQKLDVFSERRPFFKSVLGVFYSELITLGLVEIGLFVVLFYNPNIDMKQKKLFAKVHFMFFYTAIFNLLTSSTLAIISFAISRRSWVTTEKLDLDHYVAIRQEFDAVEGRLMMVDLHGRKQKHTDKHAVVEGMLEDNATEDTLRWWVALKLRINHPKLMQRYKKLLPQVRFHELRYHFIVKNSLPLNFMVSDYLTRAQLKVLIDFVHITLFCWLSLMALTNLVYFTMSMVALVDASKTGTAFHAMFIISCLIFVLVCVAMNERMKWIFSRIMHMKLGDVQNDANISSELSEQAPNDHGLNSNSKRAVLRFSPGEQRSLFWGGNPKIVTGSIQLMQFGFSLFFSLLTIFWKDVEKGKGMIEGKGLLWICIVSWLIFVTLMGHVIPRFTLCTSLGQLLDTKLLHECRAKYYLEDELKKNRKQIEAIRATTELRRVSMPHEVDGPAASTSQLIVKASKPNVSLDFPHGNRRESTDHGAKLAGLVNTSTTDLPMFPAAEKGKHLFDSLKTKKNAILDSVKAISSRWDVSADVVGEEHAKAAPLPKPYVVGEGHYADTGDRLIETNVVQENLPRKHSRTDCTSKNGATAEGAPSAFREGTEAKPSSCCNALPSSNSIRKVLLTRRYRQLSHVFGTMVCFFMVALRMDVLLVASGVTKSNPGALSLSGSVAFWIEFTWLILFMLASAATFVLFSTSAEKGGDVRMCIASVLDIILSSTCFILLVLAEGQRTTGSFGSEARMADGLGKIEPYTSLIGLRVVRFSAARVFQSLWQRIPLQRRSLAESSKSSEIKAASEEEQHCVDKSKVIELWRQGVAAHPEIVQTYGAFSTELLQAMLGIPMTEGSHDLSTHSGHERSRVAPASRADHNAGKKDFNFTRASMVVQGNYDNLAPETKALLLAGLVQRRMAIHDLPKETVVDGHFDEFDMKENAVEASDIVNRELSMLVDPDADVILSMRRCERKVLPFLSNWSVVDVALTDYELVLFEASGYVVDDGAKLSSEQDGEPAINDRASVLRRQVCDAMVATDGGKGLRLREVAAGRRIVGHFDLSGVEDIKVEKYQPAHSHQSPASNANNHLVKEYWMTPEPAKSETVATDEEGFCELIQKRWERVEECRLKIRRREETLILRFFSDLNEAEMRLHEPNKDIDLRNRDAFLWCCRIVRLCGREHLNEKDSNEDDLLHYLELHDRNGSEEQKGWMRLRSRASVGIRTRASTVVKIPSNSLSTNRRATVFSGRPSEKPLPLIMTKCDSARNL